LFANPRHPYTRALLSAIPVPAPGLTRERIILHGEMPSALHPPAGCAFHTRCPVAIEQCRTVRPELVGNEHATACHRSDELPPANVGLGQWHRSPSLERLVNSFPPDRIGRAVAVLIHSKSGGVSRKRERSPMRSLRLATATMLLLASASVACAQTALRIGLAEDPDILDPTLARTYVGRIVFASFCDK